MQEQPQLEDTAFRSQFAALLANAPDGTIKDHHFLRVESNRPPWTDTGIDLEAGDQVSTFSTGRTAITGTPLSFSSQFQIWFRIGEDGFIAAFVSGLVFGNFVRGRCGFLFGFAEAEGQLLVLLTFLIFGAAILPQAFGEVDWVIPLYAVLSLTVIRIIPIAISLIGSGVQNVTVAFVGWFGPRGLASILFALFVLEEVPTNAGSRVLVITVVTVALSILCHGLSAAPMSRRYAARIARMRKVEEMKPVSEMPTRGRISSHS